MATNASSDTHQRGTEWRIADSSANPPNNHIPDRVLEAPEDDANVVDELLASTVLIGTPDRHT